MTELAAAAATAAAASSCSICMAEDISMPCTLKECGHVFCSPCIRSWCQKQLRCPLCNRNIRTLVTPEGSEEVVEQPVPNNEVPDLDCLDHQYMLGDITRVLSRARAFHDTLMRDTFGGGCGRGGGGTGRDKHLAEATLVSVQGVMNRLMQFKLLMENEMRYDVHQVLNDMYCLNDTLSDLQSSFRRGVAPPSLPTILAASAAPAAVLQHGGANGISAAAQLAGHDAEHYPYEDDEEADDDEHDCYYDDHGAGGTGGCGAARSAKTAPGRRSVPWGSRVRGAAKR